MIFNQHLVILGRLKYIISINFHQHSEIGIITPPFMIAMQGKIEMLHTLPQLVSVEPL